MQDLRGKNNRKLLRGMPANRLKDENIYFGLENRQRERLISDNDQLRSSLDLKNRKRLFTQQEDALVRSYDFDAQTVKPVFLNCVNHKKKLAEYRVQVQGQSILYCKKCAVLLASQKFQVLALHSYQNEEKRESREKELKQLTNKLQEIRPRLQMSMSKLDQDRQRVDSHYLQIEELIIEFYQNVMREIQSAKEKSLSRMVSLKKKSIQLVTAHRQVICQQLQELQRIHQDIDRNFSSIVSSKEITEQLFKPIIQKYHRMSDFYLQKWEQVQKLDTQLVKVQLPGKAEMRQVQFKPIKVHFDKERRPPFRNIFCQYDNDSVRI